MNHFLFIVVLLLSGSVAAVQSNLPLDQAARDGNLVEVKRLLAKAPTRMKSISGGQLHLPELLVSAPIPNHTQRLFACS